MTGRYSRAKALAITHGGGICPLLKAGVKA